MQHGVVEGEPGIFPAPVARFMRGIGRLFGGRKHEDREPDEATMDELPPFPERPADAPPPPARPATSTEGERPPPT